MVSRSFEALISDVGHYQRKCGLLNDDDVIIQEVAGNKCILSDPLNRRLFQHSLAGLSESVKPQWQVVVEQ